MSSIQDSNRPDGAPSDVPSDGGLLVEVNIAVPAAAAQRTAVERAVRVAAAHRGCTRGAIGVAVVDDAAIHQVNRRHLQHDYPTDVISFPYALHRPHVEGELVVSWQTAQREAADAGWQAAQELILYVVHGTLHITGMRDELPGERQAMRRAEAEVLARLGIAPPEGAPHTAHASRAGDGPPQ